MYICGQDILPNISVFDDWKWQVVLTLLIAIGGLVISWMNYAKAKNDEKVKLVLRGHYSYLELGEGVREWGIEVHITNLSKFPIEICELGINLRNPKVTLIKEGAIIILPSDGLIGGIGFEMRKLDLRESTTYCFRSDLFEGNCSKVYEVFASTSCQVTKTGCKNLMALIRKYGFNDDNIQKLFFPSAAK